MGFRKVTVQVTNTHVQYASDIMFYAHKTFFYFFFKKKLLTSLQAKLNLSSHFPLYFRSRSLNPLKKISPIEVVNTPIPCDNDIISDAYRTYFFVLFPTTFDQL